MSTDLYGIRVLEKAPAEKKVTLRVFVVYYDTEDKSHMSLPRDPSFFLRILSGAVPYGESLPGIEDDQLFNNTWVNNNTHRFIERVKQLSTRNFPVTDYSGYSDFYYGDGPWTDEEKLVQADYEVVFRDTRYLDYLEPGQSWGTTSYETKSLQLSLTDVDLLPRVAEKPLRLEPFEGDEEAGTPDSFVFSADGRLLITQSQASELVAFESGTWQEVWRTPQEPGFFTYLNASQAAGVVWLQEFRGAFGDARVVAVREQASGQASAWRPALSTARLMSPGGTYFVAFSDEYKLSFLDEQGEESWSIEQPAEVEVVSFSADDRLVVVGGMYNHVSIWNLDTRTEIQTIATTERATGLALDPSNTYLAVCHFHSLDIYHLGRGEKVLSYTSPHDLLSKAAWSPDGAWFALNFVGGDYGYGGYIGIFPVGEAR